MQQDAHEFLNHLLNTCGDILLGRFRLADRGTCFSSSPLAEKKEEREKHEKQRLKLSGTAISNHHALWNDADGQQHRVTTPVNVNFHQDSMSSEETWIQDLFQGTLVSTTRCLNCETVMSRINEL